MKSWCRRSRAQSGFMKNDQSTISGRQRRVRGFTLIELMIAVVIIAVLAAVAFPQYLGAVRKTRRSEAVNALSSVQQAQERWRANNTQYTGSLTDLNPSMPATAAITSPGGYYSLAIDSSSGTGYVLTASAVSSKSQAADTPCTTMQVQLLNGNLNYTPSPCWAQ
jgi:type IV pilus assembly protein PilE